MTKWRVLRGAAYTGMIVAVVLCSQQQIVAANAGSVDVCVTMSGGNSEVGGLQMDLSWDAGCMTAQRAQGNAALCTSNAATGKSVQTALLANNLMRVLFLSMSDKSPIPDGQLFCCSFTPATAQANPCCSVSTSNLILAGPEGGRLYVSSLPYISVEAQVNGISCAASVPGGSPGNPVRPPVPAAAIVQPPVVSAPGAAPAAPAPGALVPVMPRPNLPAEAPPVQGEPAEAQAPELAPTEAAPSPLVTPEAAKTSTAVETAVPTAPRTPAPATATTPRRTPQIQGTPTGPAPSVTAAAPSATRPAKTPTPKHKKHKGHKKRHAS
jgi:hypothetical protein